MSEFLDRFTEAFMAIDDDDLTKMEALLADDVELVTPERTLRGRAEAMTYFGANKGAFTNVRHVVDFENGVIDAGDALAVEFVITGTFTGALDPSQGMAPTDGDGADTIAATGRDFELRSTDHVWQTDGRISRFNIYYDTGAFFDQFGLPRPGTVAAGSE